MNIYTKTIPHSEHRKIDGVTYDTVGDWWFDEQGDLQIRVSDMGDPSYEYLVARHEQDEAMICQHRGIKEEDVAAFDMQFEKERAEGLHSPEAEPGADLKAPYYDAHLIATSHERLFAPFLDVDYEAYDAAVTSL